MSGGGGNKAPAGYQPAYQAQADQSYQNLIAGATPWAQGLPQSVIPGLTSAASAVQGNPYFNQAMAGAQTAAGDAATTSQYQQRGGLNLYNAGNLASGLGTGLSQQALGVGEQAGQIGDLANLSSQNAILRGQKVFGEGQQGYGETQGLIPSTTGGAAYAPGLLANAQGLANLTAGTALGAIPGLTGGMDAASSILNTGFDPQRALYDRNYQQMLDQQNAINSQSGVATSPYGAGLAGDASRNFNIDWQNNQLQRQIASLGAYGGEQSNIANILTGLLGSASQNYQGLSGLGTNQYNAMTSGAVNNLTNLVNTGMGAANTGFQDYNAGMNTFLQGAGLDLQAKQQQQGALTNSGNLFNQGLQGMGAAYGQGSQLGIDALQTGLAGATAPSSTYLQQQQANIGSLEALAQGGSTSLGPTNQLIQDQGQYLQIGQGATQNAQNAAKINNSANDAMWSSLGQAAGTAAMFFL